MSTTTFIVVGLATVEQFDKRTVTRATPRRTAPTDLQSCRDRLQQNCCECETNCWEILQNTFQDSAKVMADMRLRLQHCKRHQQTSFLFEMLKNMRRKGMKAKKFTIDFHIHGRRVCGHVWCEFMGLSYGDSRIKKVLAALRRGDTEWVAHSVVARTHVHG